MKKKKKVKGVLSSISPYKYATGLSHSIHTSTADLVDTGIIL